MTMLCTGGGDGGEIVAAARLCVHDRLADAPDGEMFESLELPTPVASLNRLVVSRAHRGLGLAHRFDALRIRRAAELGARVAIATPVDRGFSLDF